MDGLYAWPLYMNIEARGVFKLIPIDVRWMPLSMYILPEWSLKLELESGGWLVSGTYQYISLSDGDTEGGNVMIKVYGNIK